MKRVKYDIHVFQQTNLSAVKVQTTGFLFSNNLDIHVTIHVMKGSASSLCLDKQVILLFVELSKYNTSSTPVKRLSCPSFQTEICLRNAEAIGGSSCEEERYCACLCER